MECGAGNERSPRAASRCGRRGNSWRTSGQRWPRRSGARSNARGAPGRTRRGRRHYLSPSAVATPVETATAPKRSQREPSRAGDLLGRFHEVRDFTTALCRDLAPEDCVVQSMPDVSPTKWHLAHTTWFFETFILKKWMTGYQPEIPEYAYLFNSYYNAAGDMHRRDLRGLISRPTVAEALRYRSLVDEKIDNLISNGDEKLFCEIEPIITLGM